MRLIELTANQESFRTVRFNPYGLTLIVGKQSNPDDKSLENSTNGVGKSLLLYLVSFCLGSDSNNELKEQLPDWEFSLSYELENQSHVVTRSTNNQSTLILDDNEVSLKKFRLSLGEKIFGLSDSTKQLSFRFLLRLFLRLGKPAYISEDKTFDKETAFQGQLRNSYLLGLNEDRAIKKMELREEQVQLTKIRSQFKADSFLRDYFNGNRDATLELDDIDEEIENLKANISVFKVADNYEQMAIEAEDIRRRYQQIRNNLNSLHSSLKQIEASLTEQPDASTSAVEEMYLSAQIELPEIILKQMKEVSEFHRNLVESRRLRLTSEKHEIEQQITELNESAAKLNILRDEYYQFLGSHGALQEYEALHAKLTELQRQSDRLHDFQRLEQECKERSLKNRLEMDQENIRTTDYLKAAKQLTDAVNEIFRTMARRIRPNYTCGLKVKNNEKNNKIRYDIDARIQGDASDGISETKIFCFDMTVLIGGRNHKMNFLMHDNRLFHGIDPRQCAELFRIADEMSTENHCQYIASINESNLFAIRNKLEDDDEFQSLFVENTVLELTDSSDKGKLLGITVDLDYDKQRKRSE